MNKRSVAAIVLFALIVLGFVVFAFADEAHQRTIEYSYADPSDIKWVEVQWRCAEDSWEPEPAHRIEYSSELEVADVLTIEFLRDGPVTVRARASDVLDNVSKWTELVGGIDTTGPECGFLKWKE
jgi:hypothetical protein